MIRRTRPGTLQSNGRSLLPLHPTTERAYSRGGLFERQATMTETVHTAMWVFAFLLENVVLAVVCVMWGKAHPNIVSTIAEAVTKVEKKIGG